MCHYIDITDFPSPAFTYSHSIADGGDDAGRNTWNAAKSASWRPLKTPEQRRAFAEVLEDAGYSEQPKDSEIDALFLQYVSGDIREAGAESVVEIDWDQYQIDSEAGRVAGNMFRGADGRVLFVLDPLPRFQQSA